MFSKIKEILFDWPDPNEKNLEMVNAAYDSLMEEFKYMDYKTYLRTKHWVRIKEEALKRAGFKCQACNISDADLSVYHNNYDNRGRETRDDVIALCETCHAKIRSKEK
ncbi:MAG: hypothetical protein P4L49_12285 [Desulfosporosinus sp.]|nr:hypothetical protein [Desulfosporosinus sp.]